MTVDARADHGIKIARVTRTMRAGVSRQTIFDFLKCRVVMFLFSVLVEVGLLTALTFFSFVVVSEVAFQCHKRKRASKVLT